jgi:hypothetical protein
MSREMDARITVGVDKSGVFVLYLVWDTKGGIHPPSQMRTMLEWWCCGAS